MATQEVFKAREYLLESDAEGQRLQDQQDMFRAANGDKILLAPIDLTKPNLHIHDIGTYDATFLLDLYSLFIPEGTRKTDWMLAVDLLGAHFPSKPVKEMQSQK
ncbi:uncharacterized protein BDZ99DRAFT_541326 [Mytilinidion resinicola]|uniref:Uncharacterized protein n=1 Tax=Mytilinidion resinicola TaxID=574789 RepID=A0A6A6Z4L2_9PEZI|nr:uncharacterized protein BDZ99DRAFT_541326 [Mytilinidion resinicola]KAF2815603.1 hypothetical protein BDZ99DRAFT_541326 [Mytilinidion resinicola]